MVHAVASDGNVRQERQFLGGDLQWIEFTPTMKGEAILPSMLQREQPFHYDVSLILASVLFLLV
jgi:hypothetical protein